MGESFHFKTLYKQVVKEHPAVVPGPNVAIPFYFVENAHYPEQV